MLRIVLFLLGLQHITVFADVQSVEYASNPLVVGNQLIISAQGVMAYDRLSLEPSWQLLAGIKTQAPVKAADSLILVSSSTGLYAIESDSGKIRWQKSSRAMLFSATVAAGVAYMTSETGELQAIVSNTGESLWKKQLPGWIYPPAIHDWLLYTGGSEGKLWAINRNDGTMQWERELGQEMVYSPFALSHGGIVVTTFAGKVMAFSETGELLWQTELPAVVSSLVEEGGRLVLNGLDHHLYGLDSQSGNLLWTKPLHETLAVPLDRQQEAVMLALGDGRLIELDIQTGKQHELAQVTGNPVTAPYIQGNSIIVFIKSFGSAQGVILIRNINDNPKMEI